MTTKPLLAAEKLNNDPRLAKAKQLILDAVAEHQETLVSVRPPRPELVVDYEQLLDFILTTRKGSRNYFNPTPTLL